MDLMKSPEHRGTDQLVAIGCMFAEEVDRRSGMLPWRRWRDFELVDGDRGSHILVDDGGDTWLLLQNLKAY